MVFDDLAVSLLSILVGLYVGLLRGGLLRNIACVRIERPGLLVVGVVLPALVDRVDLAQGTLLVAIALAALLVFTRRNRHLAGMGVVAIGVVCNLVVLVANGAMPVRAEALVDARLADAHEVDRVEIAGVQRLERDGDVLMPLADIVPLPETRQVLSFGDLIIVVGLASVAASLLQRRERRDATEASRGNRGAYGRPPHRTRAVAADAGPRERRIPDFEPIVLDADTAPVLAGAITALE
ncbi:MAG TPA: DUF5317 family protein [Acidimicrobiales bacterium]